ncbi:hypothetical protein [Pseudotenacibaculum haliotis]|uniref:Uncharacterized protein n=1 Tax=Pseudotenacibaculum haliotis TaxID=1862138 RepID=A0ABW5LSK2_9FLAO
MADKDQEMLDYIDEYIVRGRTSDAAEDSAGAAWAAYQRGEFDVPDWYTKERRSRKRGKKMESSTYKKGLSITWDSFLRSMGILFLILIILVFFVTILS